MNRVTTTLKEHEGLWYLEVTACAPDKSVVYAVNAWVDSDPGLRSLLQDHRWFLNRTTKHICCQKARGLLADAMAEQGHTGQFSLARAVATLSLRGTGKKIRQVAARPHDARLESITIMLQHEAMSPAETADLFGRMAALIPVEPERQLHIPQYERMPSAAEQRHALAEQRREVTERNRAIADARRAEADERRRVSEQRAQVKHFERLQAKAERDGRRAAKIAGRALSAVCQAQADIMLQEAKAAGAPWAEDAARVYAGQKPQTLIPAPADYVRLRKGLPIAIAQADAIAEYPERYRRAQAAFEEYVGLFPPGLSRAAMRAAWVRNYPEHDWVVWEDSWYSPMLERHHERTDSAPQVATTPSLPAPSPRDLDAEFEAKWARGETACGLPAPRLAEWDVKFATCEDRDEREALRREMVAEEKEHARAHFLKDNQ